MFKDKLKQASFIIPLSVLSFSALSAAESTIEERCKEDLLTEEEAKGRRAWAKKCGHTYSWQDNDMLYDQKGNEREVAFYPIVTDSDYTKVFIAPTRAPTDKSELWLCKLPDNYDVQYGGHACVPEVDTRFND